jgi:vancomycin resistance protein YoaR
MERQQAIAAVESRARTTMQRPVEFRLVSSTERVSASKLGLGVNAARTVDRAFEVGRTGGAFSKWSARYQVWRDGKQVAPVVEFDADAAREALGGMAATVNRPVRDATLVLTAQGPIIQPSQVGYELDAAATESRLPSSLETLHAQDRPVAAVIHTIEPAVREAQLASARDAIVATSNRPLRLSFQGRVWSMAPEQVRPLIRLTGEGASVQPALQVALLRRWAQQVSADINRPPRNARIDVQPGSVRLKPAQVGYATNPASTVERIQGTAFASAAPVPVGVRIVRPAIGDADLQPEVRGAHAMVSRPLRLRYADREWTLTPAQLTALLRWKGNDPNRTPYLAPAPLEAWVRGAAEEIDTSARDARIEVQDGLARVFAEAPGTRVDTQKTLASVQRALDDPRGVVAVTTVRVPASVSATDLQAAATRANRLIGSAVSVDHQGQTWTIDTSTLQDWLYWTGEGKDVAPALDEEQVYAFAQNIAYEVYQEPKSAYVELEAGGLPELIPEVRGVDVDVDSTAEVIRTLAASENREGVVTAFGVDPAVSAADLQDDFDQIAAWSSDRFYVSMDDDHTWWLDREDIADVTFWNNAGGAEIEPYLDVATMEQQIRRWVKAPPKTVIDYETTAANAVEALERGDRSVALEYSVI